MSDLEYFMTPDDEFLPLDCLEEDHENIFSYSEPCVQEYPVYRHVVTKYAARYAVSFDYEGAFIEFKTEWFDSEEDATKYVDKKQKELSIKWDTETEAGRTWRSK